MCRFIILCAAFLGFVCFLALRVNSICRYACCKTGWSSCLDNQGDKWWLPGLLLRINALLWRESTFMGGYSNNFVAKANIKCISKCCNSMKISMSFRYRACWSCVSGSCCWLLRNQRASSNYRTINAAPGDQTKGETSALGVKFSGWHGVVTFSIALRNFVGIILRFNLYNLKFSIRVKHFTRRKFSRKFITLTNRCIYRHTFDWER